VLTLQSYHADKTYFVFEYGNKNAPLETDQDKTTYGLGKKGVVT
jgi:hypothetical protein